MANAKGSPGVSCMIPVYPSHLGLDLLNGMTGKVPESGAGPTVGKAKDGGEPLQDQ